METHSGDTPINRFFSYWGALLTFLAFGVLALLFVGFQKGCMAGRSQEISAVDDARRLEIGIAARTAQNDAISTWAKNEDGTLRVPPTEAISRMPGTFAAPAVSSVPVPGTPAAEAAAMAIGGTSTTTQAGASEGEESAPAPVQGDGQNGGDTESN